MFCGESQVYDKRMPESKTFSMRYRISVVIFNFLSFLSHRIRNLAGEVMFTARVIHSLPLMTSVVQVFYHDKLSVVCHLIGPDTLPTPAQVFSCFLLILHYCIVLNLHIS